MSHSTIHKLCARLAQDSVLRERLFRRMPEALRRRNDGLARALREPSLFTDSAAVQRQLARLIGRAQYAQLASRAQRVASVRLVSSDGPLDAVKGAASAEVVNIFQNKSNQVPVGILVEDVRGDAQEAEFHLTVDRTPMVIDGRHAEELDDGAVRVALGDGRTAVIHNPACDEAAAGFDYEEALLNESEDMQELFEGRLSEKFIARHLILDELFYTDRRATVINNVQVRNHPAFQPGEVYAGYAIEQPSTGTWDSLGSLFSDDWRRTDSTPDAIRFVHADGTSRDIPKTVIAKAISALRRIHYTARSAGVVIDVLHPAVRMNLDTGEISVDPGAHHLLHELKAFVDEEGSQTDALSMVDADATDPRAPFVPYVAARSLADFNLLFTVKDIDDRHAAAKAGEYNKPEHLLRAVMNDMGPRTVSCVLRHSIDMSDEYEAQSMVAFYDHLVGYIDERLRILADIPRDYGHSGAVPELINNLKSTLNSSIYPLRVLRDERATAGFERGQHMLEELVVDPVHAGRMRSVFENYLASHGTRQIAMFTSMVLPYLAQRNEGKPANFFNEANIFINRNFDSRGDVLYWGLFVDTMNDPSSPSSGPTGTDGPAEGKSENQPGRVISMFDFRSTPKPPVAQLTFPATMAHSARFFMQ